MHLHLPIRYVKLNAKYKTFKVDVDLGRPTKELYTVLGILISAIESAKGCDHAPEEISC